MSTNTAMQILLGAFGQLIHESQLRSQGAGRKVSYMPRGGNVHTPHQGKKEIARRKKQIADGKLQVSK